MKGLKTGLGITPGEHIISADSALSRNIRHCFCLVCSNSYRMPYPWCVKPAGTADNVTTIIMGSGTAHTARPEVSVRRQWQDEGSKNGAWDHAG